MRMPRTPRSKSELKSGTSTGADVESTQSLDLNAGSIVAMDRGYNDYALFGKWTDRGVFFVTRLKDNAASEVIESAMGPLPHNILADELIRFTGAQAVKDCPHVMRRVVVWDPINEREIVLLSNLLQFGPTTIAAIYKDRWEIELFFGASGYLVAAGARSSPPQ